jgi:NAD(P)H-hydrate repair Nnr-like enzyme with NAD(P)H-hydrate epimerase domain
MLVYERSGFSCRSYQEEGHERFLASLAHTDVIVDALLGIGVNGALSFPYDAIIHAVNSQHAAILSIDLPSGVPQMEALYHLAYKLMKPLPFSVQNLVPIHSEC